MTNDLKAFRTEHGLSQTALAEMLGITRDTIARWESGRSPTPSWLALALRGLVLVSPPPDKASDRDAACAEALQPHLDALARSAEQAGWDRAEIDTAVLALVTGDMMQIAGLPVTIAMLRQAMSAVAEAASTELGVG